MSAEFFPLYRQNIIVVTGGRTYSHPNRVYDWLDNLLDHRRCNEDIIIIQGGASGVDQFVRWWCTRNCIEFKNYPYRSDAPGKSGGSLRNLEMLLNERPDYVVAFPGGPGTIDMIKQARRERFPVIFAGLD